MKKAALVSALALSGLTNETGVMARPFVASFDECEADAVLVEERVGKQVSECDYEGDVVDASWALLRACRWRESASKAKQKEALHDLRCALVHTHDIREKGGKGEQALHVLGRYLDVYSFSGCEGLVDAIELVIDAGADSTSVRFVGDEILWRSASARGNSLIHRAADGVHARIIPSLVQAGCNVDERANTYVYWGTPLHRAVQRDTRDMVKALLEAGADPDLGDQLGDVPLHDARSCGVVELLVDYGANLEMQGYREYTPLLLAAQKGNVELVKVFLKRGANTKAREVRGRTAWEIAQDEHDSMIAMYSPRDPHYRDSYIKIKMALLLFEAQRSGEKENIEV